MKKKLILFTRYPVTGRAKTRLIPALGAEGAATLQKQMTEQTLHTAQKIADPEKLVLEIHYMDGSFEQMNNWLGPDQIYCKQGSGDLGEKISSAFAEAFKEDCQQVIIIGTDCPAITPEIIASAFGKLSDHDLVLGPALDGGYYLVGLTRPRPELFRNRSWGSSLLLGETIAAAKKLALIFFLLEELTDVDQPKDLDYISNYPDHQ